MSNVKSGFTLIELIIYTILFSILIVAGIHFSWQIIHSKTKSSVYLEVQQNARSIISIISQKIRLADDVKLSESIFGENPGKLVLDMPNTEPDITFDTYLKTINLGSQNFEIRTLRMQKGNESVDLTTNRLEVTNLTFLNLTHGSEPKNIKIKLGLKRFNPTNNPNWRAGINLETAASLRKK